MTNYTKTTDFASKDTLPSGNANKIVKGTEIDTEFNNIATAVATKADSASPTFTGVISVPDGSASAPSITNTGDTNAGLFFSAADTLAFTAGGTAQFTMADGVIAPVTDNDIDLGTSSLKFKDFYIDGIAYLDAINLNGTAVTSTAAEINILDGVTSTAAELNILDGVTSTTAELNILDGVTSTAAEINLLDGVTATTTELNYNDTGASVGTVVASKVVTVDANKDVASFRNITLTGELDAGSLDISGDADIDGTLETDALSINGTAVTSTAAELNILDGKAFLDEDNMASNSATGIASQQSIKAYVDSQVTAQDLDFQADSGGALSIDLDSETLTFTGGTGIDTSGSGNAVTFAIDSTVTTLTGSQTLTNKTLTAPTLTGTAVVASLDISGDIDVDGTTNLDVVDIDGAVDMASTLGVTGVATLASLVATTADINGGTIDGTVIGGSSAAAGTFTTFTSTGIDDNAASTAITIDSSQNVGIGTTSPTTFSGFLTVHQKNASGNAIHLVETDGGVISQIIANDANSGEVFIGARSNHPLLFTTNDTERMRIDTSGNALVGRSARLTSQSESISSDTVMSVHGVLASHQTNAGILQYASNTFTLRAYGASANTGEIAFNTGGGGGGADSEAMRIDSSGNVGINGSSAGATLQVNQSSLAYVDIRSDDSLRMRLLADSSQAILASEGVPLILKHGSTEAVRIDSSGNLLIGGLTAAPTGSTGGSGFIAESVGRRTLKIATTTTGGAGLAEFINPNGTVGSISTSGSATAFNTSSDQRLKDNIVDAPSASNDIDAIQVRSFDWKADGSHQKYGMVAQELQSVAPEAVSAPEDPEEMMGVDYSKLVPMLVKEIQSLRARVQQLENN